MTPELIAILGVGIALAAAIFVQARHNNRMIHKRFDAMEDKISEVENQISQLRERMAHLEGLLEGLRESIVGRAAA